MSTPTLSVLMANWNQAHHLSASLEAVFGQSYTPLEVILIDDASTDGSLDVLEAYAKKHAHFKLVKNKVNQGVLKNAKALLEMCRGEYLVGPACDDKVLPGFFEEAMLAAAENPQAGVLFGNVMCVDPDGRPHASRREDGIYSPTYWTKKTHANPEQYLREFLLKESPDFSPSPATVYKKSALMAIGGFRQDLGHWSDTFAIHAMALKFGACYIPKNFIQFVVHPSSFGSTSWRNAKLMIDIYSRVLYLMQNQPFSDIFSKEYVEFWKTQYRQVVLKRHLYIFDKDFAHSKKYLENIAEAGNAWDRCVSGFLIKLSGVWRRLLSAWLKHLILTYPGDARAIYRRSQS